MEYLLLIAGLATLLLGANYMVDASVAIAKRARISNFIIGLTIVGIGTSAPELFVGIKSALAGDGDIVMGNVVGSNIANILLILGITAAITPFAIERDTQRRDIPFGIAACIIMVLISSDALIPGISENTVSRVDGIFLLMLFIAYMGYTVVMKARDPKQALAEADEQAATSLEKLHPVLLWMIAVASLAALIYGGNLFLDNAKALAAAWGMSEAVISITIVAVGTSLPELVTAVIAACKNNPQLALGNVLGSNVFNCLFIMGVSATTAPLTIVGIRWADYAVMIASAIMTYVVVFTFGKHKFDRIEGFIFLATYAAYIALLLAGT